MNCFLKKGYLEVKVNERNTVVEGIKRLDFATMKLSGFPMPEPVEVKEDVYLVMEGRKVARIDNFSFDGRITLVPYKQFSISEIPSEFINQLEKLHEFMEGKLREVEVWMGEDEDMPFLYKEGKLVKKKDSDSVR